MKKLMESTKYLSLEIDRDRQLCLSTFAHLFLSRQICKVGLSIDALLATAPGVYARIFTAMQISRAMVTVGNLPGMFNHFVWKKGTLGLLVGIAGILLAVNLLELEALARIASATFLFSYLAVQVAHWRLLDETKASRFLVGLGALFIVGVLICFLWSTFVLQPWAMALIVAFVLLSWCAEWFPAGSKPVRAY
ncbi:MAG: hypothetical protein ABI142_05810 [Bryocella sp.]